MTAEALRRRALESLLQSDLQLALAVTGGSVFIARLLGMPGASGTLLEAYVPYHRKALADFLGRAPEQAASAASARAMAMVAWQRAGQLPGVSHPAGLACTASLASNRPKLGDHRAHIALQTDSLTRVRSLILEKGLRKRAEEEALLADALLAVASGHWDELVAPQLKSGDLVSGAEAKADEKWRDLLAGRIQKSLFSAHSARGGMQPKLLLPGAFNPLHEGHIRMARLASERMQCPAAFELSVLNVDKPPLDCLDLAERGKKVSAEGDLWLTRAATFEDKARLFPGVTFAVGADTLLRIADPRYYGGDEAARDLALDAIGAAGCRFLMFGRRKGSRFLSLAEPGISPQLAELTEEIPEAEFRVDISSSSIRSRQGL